MSFDSKKIEYDREHLYVIDMELDYCSNTYGGAPCTAALTGDSKCLNTLETCQDVPNYTRATTTGEQTITVNAVGKTFTRSVGSYLTDGFVVGHTITSSGFSNDANNQSELLISTLTATVMTFSTSTGLVNETGDADEVVTLNTTKVYRFCEERSPHPIGLDAIPSLKSVNISASKIDITGGLGVRSSVSLSFKDHPSSDIGIDQYPRTWDPLERGTYWTKLRSRNPNYQFRSLRVLSGYLEGNEFIESNFQKRYYVIEKMDVSNGKSSVTGKDPLKLASSKKAQAPAPSTGLLSAGVNTVSTAMTLIPAGVGNSEYDLSGFLLIGSEVMSFTRVGDALTVVRAQKNTVAAAHSANDTIQQCLEYSGATRGQLDFIVNDLLVNFAGIDSTFIPTAVWDAEVSTYLSGLLDGIIVKPFDVWKLLKELSEAMPHYLWWDERSQQINLTALKAPPTSADVLDTDENLVADSVRIADVPDMRVSTVFINFGQFDPTKKLDEFNNYLQTYVRIDTDSISKYGSSEVRTINSRWISNTNKASALQLAALIGRRFSNVPRSISFSLDAKDSDVWAGQSRSVNHWDILDPVTSLPIDTIFQIISAKESKNYQYTGLEFVYGDSLPDDEGGGGPDVDLVIFGADQQDVNLRTVYDGLFPTPDATTQVKFIVESGVVIGASVTSNDSMDTGTWPAGAIVTVQNSGHIVGGGGNGGGGNQNGFNAGDAINMQYDITINNLNIIGGGGGGGGGYWTTLTSDGGGGGAGNVVGLAGSVFASDGTTEIGGANGLFASGKGGDLGSAGDAGNITTGGAAGAAIKKNGNTLTYTTVGTIHGTVS